MSGRKRRTARDRRRRSLGQNFLADPEVVADLIADLGIGPDQLIVDLGAGSGALSLPLARSGALVWAVERDPVWAERLAELLGQSGLERRVRIVRADLRRLRFPSEPFRVVANPPFGLTTELLRLLLDDPAGSHLTRADLILQAEVARKHAAEPAVALTTAGWAPWWRFSLGPIIPASAFRPRPAVDAAVLTILRRDPPVLPARLAPGFAEVLRSTWQADRRRSP